MTTPIYEAPWYTPTVTAIALYLAVVSAAYVVWRLSDRRSKIHNWITAGIMFASLAFVDIGCRLLFKVQVSSLPARFESLGDALWAVSFAAIMAIAATCFLIGRVAYGIDRRRERDHSDEQ